MNVHGDKYIHGSEFHGSPVDIAIIIMIIITHNIIILAIMGIRLLMGSDGHGRELILVLVFVFDTEGWSILAHFFP